MTAQTARTVLLAPALSRAWEQLKVHHDRHRNSAPFWSAYQAIQDDLARSHPQHRVDVCNGLATFAERLGVVGHAQLLGEHAEHFTDARHAGSTSP